MSGTPAAIFSPHRRLRFRIRNRRRRLAERLVPCLLPARRNSATRRDHPALARGIRQLAAVSDRRRHPGGRLFAMGRDDVFSRPWLAVSSTRLRSAYRLSGDQQHPASLRAGHQAHQASQGPVICLRRLWHRRLGDDRQAGAGQGDRRGPMARLWATHSVAILRGGCSRFGRAAAPSTHRPPQFRPCRSAACHALEQLLRQDRRPDPGQGYADRLAIVESRAGEQGSGYRRIDPTVRSQPGQ